MGARLPSPANQAPDRAGCAFIQRPQDLSPSRVPSQVLGNCIRVAQCEVGAWGGTLGPGQGAGHTVGTRHTVGTLWSLGKLPGAPLAPPTPQGPSHIIYLGSQAQSCCWELQSST